MPSNYINYSDYVGANQDQIKRMEEMLRAEEQQKLQDAYNATQSAGNAAEGNAYWGELGGSEDLANFSDWQQAQDKQQIAQQYQKELQNDADQVNLLNKHKGVGGYGNLDAALVFGSNKPRVEGGNGKGVTLSEYMGYNAADLDKMDAEIAGNVDANAKDFQREYSRQQSMDSAADASQSKLDKYNQYVGPAKASALKQAKAIELARQMQKKKEMGRDFYASPDWEEYTNWLSGQGTWDKSKEASWVNALAPDWDKGGWMQYGATDNSGHILSGDQASNRVRAKLTELGLDPWAPDAPSQRYAGRLSEGRQNWEGEYGDEYRRNQPWSDY